MQYILLLVVGIVVGFGLGRFTGHPDATVPALVDSGETALAPGFTPPPPSPHAPKAAAVSEKKEESPATPTPSNAEAGNEDRESGGMAAERAGNDRGDGGGREWTSPPSYHQMDSRVVEQIEKRRRPSALNAIKQAEPVTEMSPSLRGLIGVFEGDILIDENTGRTWQIRMETEGKIVGGAFQGQSNIQLSRNGRVFSNSKNDGNLKNLRYSGSKATVWIEMGDFYLDAIYDGTTDAIVGNFYGRNPKGDYRYRGYASLNRR